MISLSPYMYTPVQHRGCGRDDGSALLCLIILSLMVAWPSLNEQRVLVASFGPPPLLSHRLLRPSTRNRVKETTTTLTSIRRDSASSTLVESSTSSSSSSSSKTCTRKDNNDLPKDTEEPKSTTTSATRKLQGRLLKSMRQTALDYQMLEDGDHIMVAVSGGKDSATLLFLLRELQSRLPVSFNLTAVHVDQKQPGYDGRPLVTWLESLDVDYRIVEEDTYSITVEKTQPGKSYCTVCSRLRRGTLYTTALRLGCNKIALGHHADDCLETALLNMLHAGQLKAMPARCASRRGQLAVLRPMVRCWEDDIAAYAAAQNFPILPCQMCGNQANLQRPQVKLLLSTILTSLNPNAKKNLLQALHAVKPSHLLDQRLREACGLDAVTGEHKCDTIAFTDVLNDDDDDFLDDDDDDEDEPF